MVDAAYEELYRAMRPGMRENECVGLVNKVLYDMGSEFVEGVNAISGERCSPHPHVYTDRALRPGDPAYFDILHSFMGYRTCYYRTFAVASASSALVDAYKRCRYYLDAAIDLIRPGVTTGEVVEVWPKAEEFGFPDEEAAFALQFGHGVGLAIWEKPIFSRLVSLDHPEEIQEGMVFALETFWPSSDGWSAARIEEQLVVTADGCEVITRFPSEDLVIAGKPYYTVGGTLPLERDHQSNLNTRLDADDARGACPATAACRPAIRCASSRVRAAVVEAMGRPPAAAEVPEPQQAPGRGAGADPRRGAEPGRAAHLERPLLRRAAAAALRDRAGGSRRGRGGRAARARHARARGVRAPGLRPRRRRRASTRSRPRSPTRPTAPRRRPWRRSATSSTTSRPPRSASRCSPR